MTSRRMIAAIDEAILPYPPAAVRRVVGDLAHYQDWWGPPYRFETIQDRDGAVGTSVRMSNGSLLLWTAAVSEADPNRVVLRLDQGAWTGEARWSVSPCQEGTRLIFRIDVDPRPLWLRLLARTMDFKNRHSHQMIKVFTRLRERMDAQHAPQNQDAGAAPAVGPAVSGPAVSKRAVSGPTA
jgi:hypothetical protein